jgi:tetratricopeptide (TPR) repeat protein
MNIELTFVPIDDSHLRAIARRLAGAGEWEAALKLLSEPAASGRPETDRLSLIAEIQVDLHWWRMDDPVQAAIAVRRLDPKSAPSQYLRARMAYQRILFDDDPRADDLKTATSGFTFASGDHQLRHWGTFYLGLLADNVLGEPLQALHCYHQAYDGCRNNADVLLESYVVRQLGGQIKAQDTAQAEMLLRRSLHLRSTLGVRPLVAASQLTLADVLADGPERNTLLAAARITVNELNLTWLKP